MKEPIIKIEEEENVIKKTCKLKRTLAALSELLVDKEQALSQKTTNLIEEADTLFAELYEDFDKYQENLDAIKLFVIKEVKAANKRLK